MEHEARTGNESETASYSVEAAIFSNVGNEILQPVVASEMGHRKKDSYGGKGNNSFDLADFEGDSSTPFELVELQTINDLDELKNVLQPCTVQGGVEETFITSNNRRKADVPSSNVASTDVSVGNQCPLKNLVADAPAPVVKPTPLPCTKQLHSSCKNCSVRGAIGCTCTNSATNGSHLIYIGDSVIKSRESSAMSTSGSTVTTTSYATNPLFHSINDLNSRPVSRGRLLPPLGSSQPCPMQEPFQRSTCISNSHSHNQGIYAAPARVENGEQYLDTCPKGNYREALIKEDMQDNPEVSSFGSRSAEHQVS